MIFKGLHIKKTFAEKQFASWLTTQLNAQGKPYVAAVANRYAACLRTEPLKLDIPLTAEERDMYRCQTLQDFDRLEKIFLAASNFREVNLGDSRWAFSAGLSAYRRYLRYLECGVEKTAEVLPLQHLTEVPPTDFEIKRVDFREPSACTGCCPVSCVVEGQSFSVHNWRDILFELTNYFLATKPRMQELTQCSIYQRGTRPFLLKAKPDRYMASRQVSNGCWIYLNLSISNLVSDIGRLCEYCEVPFEDVDIRYVSKTATASSGIPLSSGSRHELVRREDKSIPAVIFDALNRTYAGGFRFDSTAITLLSSAAGIPIDEELKAELKCSMFGRKDALYFLPDQIASKKTQAALSATTDEYLNKYGCFEINEVYRQFQNLLNTSCIKTTEDFEDYYIWAFNRNVRCVTAPQVGNRIARYNDGNVWASFNKVGKEIIAFINEQHYGSCTEDELHEEFSAFSKELLEKIVRSCASGELVRVIINDTVCYQSYMALGIPDDFSKVLSAVLARLEEIGLPATQETLHTALSLELGVNISSEFGLPDWDSFRRLITAYDKGAPCREWKKGTFVEVDV